MPFRSTNCNLFKFISNICVCGHVCVCITILALVLYGHETQSFTFRKLYYMSEHSVQEKIST